MSGRVIVSIYMFCVTFLVASLILLAQTTEPKTDIEGGRAEVILTFGEIWLGFEQGSAAYLIQVEAIQAVSHSSHDNRYTIYFSGGKVSTDIDIIRLFRESGTRKIEFLKKLENIP